MAAKRRILATGARVVTGVVVAAVAVVVAGTALAVPLPSVTATPASFTVDPAPAESVRACTGPLVRLSDDTGQDATAISSVGSATVIASSTQGAEVLERSALASPDDIVSADGTAPARIALPADAGADALFAAVQSQTIANGDLVGFAATACGEADSDSWLVAGATTVGRTSFVVLSNPGDVAAVVDLTIYGDAGVVESPGAKNLDVPARSTRILSLAGLAPDLSDPVIHVQTSVGAVTAAVQQSVVRGLEPGGVEMAGPTSGPATTQTIAGVQVAGTSTIAERLGDPDASDLQSVLRMFVPGDTPASVTVRIAEEKTGGAQSEYQVGLTPQVVTEFPLQDIPDGIYTVEIESDQPLVAGARTSTIGNGVLDFAWYQAVQPLDPSFFVATADGSNPRLHIVNTTGADVTLTLTTTTGVVNDVTIVPGVRYVPLTAGESYTVTSSAPVSAAVTYFQPGSSSSFPIVSPSPAASSIVVYP
ncbi:DUF5719 family protein [Herbiconiux ginsengi]|uniref:Large extracellular alpha-helical protein n=1 Tax=Herbiconiux ginsengi TaxID=381665 RepID=A0A1H3SUH8_9MICO|nr:DUF5719 family protein [Herbiconiux ginsengi]SDZ41632.1 hypothetical protein SAMN05216554_3716 [Herbiconiux ginsengi]